MFAHLDPEEPHVENRDHLPSGVARQVPHGAGPGRVSQPPASMSA